MDQVLKGDDWLRVYGGGLGRLAATRVLCYLYLAKLAS